MGANMSDEAAKEVRPDPERCCPRHRELLGARVMDVTIDPKYAEGDGCPLCAAMQGPMGAAGLPEEAGAMLEGLLATVLGHPKAGARIMGHGVQRAARRWMGAVERERSEQNQKPEGSDDG